MPLVSSFNPAKTLFGRWAHALFTPTVGDPVQIRAKVGEIDAKTTTVGRKTPASDNINRTDREEASEADESITLTDVEEVDAVIAMFGGQLTGLLQGSVQFFFADPKDASGKIRYSTNQFACSVLRDGNLKIGGGDFTKNPTLKFNNISGEAIEFTVGGNLPS